MNPKSASSCSRTLPWKTAALMVSLAAIPFVAAAQAPVLITKPDLIVEGPVMGSFQGWGPWEQAHTWTVKNVGTGYSPATQLRIRCEVLYGQGPKTHAASARTLPES